MGIAKQFSRVIRRELRVQAAWLPVVNVFSLGDYGVIDGGIFVRRGNIKTDFKISFETLESPDAHINFKSKGTRLIKLDVGVPVQSIPASSVNAQVKVQFSGARSFLIQSPLIKVKEIASPNVLAMTLSGQSFWRPEYKVVHQVYHAKKAVVVSTKESNTELIFSGQAKALNDLDLGHAALSMSFNKSIGLDLNGKEGIIGLGLFRIMDGQMGVVRGKAKSELKKTRIERIGGEEMEDDF
jgi:hypothetical protein